MDGCTRLGVLYGRGAGVAKDPVRAAALFQQACDGKNMTGCARLGAAYSSGEGVAQDFARAADLLKRSCDEGRTRLRRTRTASRGRHRDHSQ
jgi:TPR repeat protein